MVKEIIIEYNEIKDKFYISTKRTTKTFFGEWAFQEYLRELNFPEDRIIELTNKVILNKRVEL